MRPVTSFGVQFQLRLSRNINGMAPLTVRITVSGQRKEISLEHKVAVNKWLSKEEKLKGGEPDARAINSYIEEMRSKLYESKRQLVLTQQMVTPEAIWNNFLGKDLNEKSLLDVIQYHNDTMKDTLAWGTAKNYYTTQKYITEFLKEKVKTSDVYLSQLNYKFLTDFEMFLRTHVPGENQKPCGNNTVMKHIERFRKIVSMAVRNDWLKQDPFIKFKPNFIRKERGFLTEEELNIIENKEFSIARIEAVRDMFIFSCYTGLAYADASNLTPDQVQIGINGKKWLMIHRQKTGIQANIPLLSKALQIIEKYKTHPKCIATGRLLPMIANQPFNSFLKEIAIICGINKNLTHHLARHTFATTVCLLNGISMEATSGMLGHTSVRTTQIYGKILPQRISREMEMLEQKFLSVNSKFNIKSNY